MKSKSIPILNSVGVVIVFVSILFTISFYEQYRSKKKLSYFRVHEPKLLIREGGDFLGNKKILLLGDSRIEDWEEMYLNSFKVVINAGSGGETTFGMAARVEALLDDVKPDVVVVCSGINDMVIASLYSNPQKKIEMTASAKKNLMYVIDKIKDRGALVIILTITPPYNVDLYRWVLWGGGIEDSVNEVNESLVSLREGKVEVIDLNELFSLSSGQLNSSYSRDALHYTPKAYKLISDKVNALSVGVK